MIQCPKCSAENLPDSRFCSSCAQPLSAPSQLPTMEAPAAEAKKVAETPHVARIVSSDSIPAGGFTPGTILADRYRIIGLLGRGGMGEVYRADDLKLGQPVALKFLPPKLAEDPVRRERFFAEVRITRQLSHPNICRVYDIGEIDGRHFLSMEFIDGEDLASLLKRIGHLTNEKALDIARQLAAGLAAAHERGVLHRDLKPANIMLDGHGRVRITDFGLAIAVEDESQATEIAGTPAYMAPEQLAGKGATVRSDMYSLGLVLYEIYTGKKAFTAATLAELRQQKETYTPRAPSEIREGIDPVVERLIRRCMERDPNARPASVAQLALALPGGDPLAAAIAAGETPSPEMVAASGSKEGLRPHVAWGILAIILVASIAAIAIKDRIVLYRRIPFEKPPQALAELSQNIIRKAGFSEKFADSAYGFKENSDLLHYIEESDKSANRWNNLDSRAILFWYRQSPRQLGVFGLNTLGSTAWNNPPLQYPGEVLVMLDTEGHLVSLRRVPPRVQPMAEAAVKPDWTPFFTEAGLDISQWIPADPQWSPLSYADNRSAWTGSLPNRPGTPVRIEVASFQGKPVSFEIIGPWNREAQTEPVPLRGRMLIQQIATGLLFLPAIIGGIFFARRNSKLGRGDRRGAMRLAIFILVLNASSWILQLPDISFLNLFLSPYFAVLYWILYMAVEPFVRRRWPGVLVSWTRLLSGEWRDPLVARDMFVGFAVGALVGCIHCIVAAIPSRIHWAGFNYLPPIDLGEILGARFAAALFLDGIPTYIGIGLVFVCLLVTLRLLLRSQWVAIIAIVLIGAMAFAAGPIAGSIVAASIMFLVMRFGLIAAFAFWFAYGLIFESSAILQSTWYSGYGFLSLAVFAALVLYSFRTSLAGRPLIATPQLDD
jgi:serine/threonine protein kinase